MNAAHPLLKAVGVPGDVVIDHQMCALEVNAFTCCVGRHQDLDVLVLGKRLLSVSPLFSPNTSAMKGL